MTRVLQRIFLPLFVGAVVVQGAHVAEHVIQLVQVYVLGVPDDDALGLLGYVLQFNGTEEWLHFAFNTTYLLSLYLLLVPLQRLVPEDLPHWAFAAFIGTVSVESWHVIEHGVIISHVIANNGCPCPGIGDAALGLSDTVLHFFYNAFAYAGLVVAFLCVGPGRRRSEALPHGPERLAAAS